MEPEDRSETRRREMERDTVNGVRTVWIILAAVAALGSLSALLYLELPPIWTTVGIVLLAVLIAGWVLARGLNRPRRRL